MKRLTINPKSCTSLQYHNYRDEHWTVVNGIATVTKGDYAFDLVRNESIVISAQTKHRVANNTDSSLEIIEVQVGSELSEEDIVRLEDVYGRVLSK